ncbi:carbonic anhydrase [Sphingomonas hankyongi]|uniref:carbonic anhydrase n=1 Tax=Sphingomonas hankyongi TaxID=2908209 RepID=A0ABT0S5J8_9SPHN|nr:carbonic anhydrase family protein [Sphingomonas hankyongi]MCL6730881.1 carbonic anhydrase family protein [Sphingomonas hankyongi]
MNLASTVALGTAIILGSSALASAETHHWSYFGKEGPTHWAELNDQFKACAAGKNQSPIDIDTHRIQTAALPALQFDYQSSALHIVDNGHTVQVNLDPGSSLAVGKDRYQLVQLHFHHPSEERIDGRRADMVAHLVHRDAEGRLAVVAVLLTSGKQNDMVEALWDHLPKHKDSEASPKGVRIDPAALIPPKHSYFTYIGSLTTPPCTEGVRWLVLKSPQTLSEKEIATFAAHYPNDARPIQQLNHRKVLSTN